MLFLKSINLLKSMFNTNKFSHSFGSLGVNKMQQHWLHLSLALIPSVEMSNDVYKFSGAKVYPTWILSLTLFFLILLMRKEGSKGGREEGRRNSH